MTETHPYNQYFDYKADHKYLIIGTFPPELESRSSTNYAFRYFYGNRGSIWNILNQTNLFTQDELTSKNSIRKWEEKYFVGVVDVLSSCNRVEGKAASSSDSDLLIRSEDLNADLKEYLLRNIGEIKMIYPTSSSPARTSNSAYALLLELMGKNWIKLHQKKIYLGLPSPSNVYLTSKAVFSPLPEYHGLNKNFYDFLLSSGHHEALTIAKNTFTEKQSKISAAINSGVDHKTIKQVRFPDTVLDYPSLYRIWQYKEAFGVLIPADKV